MDKILCIATLLQHYCAQLHRYQPRPPVPAVAGLPGEMGVKVQLAPELAEEKRERFKINQFNLVASDLISVNRSLKDVRMEACRGKVKDGNDISRNVRL